MGEKTKCQGPQSMSVLCPNGCCARISVTTHVSTSDCGTGLSVPGACSAVGFLSRGDKRPKWGFSPGPSPAHRAWAWGSGQWAGSVPHAVNPCSTHIANHSRGGLLGSGCFPLPRVDKIVRKQEDRRPRHRESGAFRSRGMEKSGGALSQGIDSHILGFGEGEQAEVFFPFPGTPYY